MSNSFSSHSLAPSLEHYLVSCWLADLLPVTLHRQRPLGWGTSALCLIQNLVKQQPSTPADWRVLCKEVVIVCVWRESSDQKQSEATLAQPSVEVIVLSRTGGECFSAANEKVVQLTGKFGPHRRQTKHLVAQEVNFFKKRVGLQSGLRSL